MDDLHKRGIFIIETFSFLHSHSNQITTTTPTLINSLNLGYIPLSRLQKIFPMPRDGYKVKPIWIAGHIDIANEITLDARGKSYN
jgi:hypothetical protein